MLFETERLYIDTYWSESDLSHFIDMKQCPIIMQYFGSSARHASQRI